MRRGLKKRDKSSLPFPRLRGFCIAAHPSRLPSGSLALGLTGPPDAGKLSRYEEWQAVNELLDTDGLLMRSPLRTGKARFGLEEHSRAPLRHPQAIAPEVREVLVNLRSRHPSWGPRKLRAYLHRDAPAIVWPAPAASGTCCDGKAWPIHAGSGNERHRIPSR